MNCTVHVRKDGCDIWVGTQAPTLTQAAVAELTGPAEGGVRSTTICSAAASAGGSKPTARPDAVKIAQQVDGPVKVVWSREEDIQHDMYRPYYYDRLSAGLDADGQAGGLDPPDRRLLGHGALRPAAVQERLRPRCGGGGGRAALRLRRTSTSTMSGSSRRACRPPSGAASGRLHNVFVVESFIDELAAAAKQDPGRLSQGAAGPQSARPRRADAGGGEGRLGLAAAERAGPRRLGAVRLRQLPVAGGRGRGGGRRLGQGPPHRLRRRLRHGRSIRTRSRRRCRAARSSA